MPRNVKNALNQEAPEIEVRTSGDSLICSLAEFTAIVTHTRSIIFSSIEYKCNSDQSLINAVKFLLLTKYNNNYITGTKKELVMFDIKQKNPNIQFKNAILSNTGVIYEDGGKIYVEQTNTYNSINEYIDKL